MNKRKSMMKQRAHSGEMYQSGKEKRFLFF